MAVAPDGRVFVCEQTGALSRRQGRAIAGPAFLDRSGRQHWERGLIGVALDPDFARNSFVYVTYVAPKPYPHHRISRFTARGDVAAAGSEIILFEGDDQTKLGGDVPAGHQGGAIHFGKDGKLYVAIGEQTAGEPAQAMDTLPGQAAADQPRRLDPRGQPFLREGQGQVPRDLGAGPAQPVHVRRAAGHRPDLHQRRGPDRLGRDRRGLRRRQLRLARDRRPTTDPRFRGPIHPYPVASIAGGAFCPTGASAQLPAAIPGKYFFMDFVKGWIKVLDPDHPRGRDLRRRA